MNKNLNVKIHRIGSLKSIYVEIDEGDKNIVYITLNDYGMNTHIKNSDTPFNELIDMVKTIYRCRNLDLDYFKKCLEIRLDVPVHIKGVCPQ